MAEELGWRFFPLSTRGGGGGGKQSFDFTASVCLVNNVFTRRQRFAWKTWKQGAANVETRLGSPLPSNLRHPSRPPSFAVVIGRGRPFHLYGPVCANVDRGIVVLVYQSAMHFSCFSTSPPLPLASFRFFFRNRPPPPSPLRHSRLVHLESRCSLSLSLFSTSTDSRVREGLERDGCRGWMNLWRERKLIEKVDPDRGSSMFFWSMFCSIGEIGLIFNSSFSEDEGTGWMSAVNPLKRELIWEIDDFDRWCGFLDICFDRYFVSPGMVWWFRIRASSKVCDDFRLLIVSRLWR